MELYTRINLPKTSFVCSYNEPLLLMGSCFAEHIGARLTDHKFAADVNPFGTLYNPASIAAALRLLLQPVAFMATDLFEHQGVYHSFMHHSRFSSTSQEACLSGMNEQLFASARQLRETKKLIVTLGTSHVYRLKKNGQVVANCHKLPERCFDRYRLSVTEIVAEWRKLLHSLRETLPEMQVLFTVSPIRHWKDGAHGNQLSKATLLLAIDELQQEAPAQVAYFPAYEFMMDELRDYRFYAHDMLHPSEQAINYIWQRFAEHYLSDETKAVFKEWEEIQKAIHHRPFQPGSAAYQQFISQTLLKIERISEKFPSFDSAKERKQLQSLVDNPTR